MAQQKKKKRKASPAQLRALAKGRAALKKKRGGATRRKSTRKKVVSRKKTTARKPVKKSNPNPKKKGNPMARKKRKRGGSFRKKARRAYSRARGFLSKKGEVMGILQDAALAVGGGIAAGVISNQLPFPDPRLKAAAPIVAGVLLATTIGRKQPLVRGVANGMVVLGAVSLAKQLMPNIPIISGEDDLLYLPDYDPALLGYQDTTEELEELTGSVQLGQDAYFSPADL